MLHVGALHQAAEVEAGARRRGQQVGRRLAGEVGVDERREVGLVGEQGGPGRGAAPPQRVAPLLLRQAVGPAPSGLGAQTLRLRLPAVTLLPAATAAPQAEGRSQRVSLGLNHHPSTTHSLSSSWKHPHTLTLRVPTPNFTYFIISTFNFQRLLFISADILS